MSSSSLKLVFITFQLQHDFDLLGIWKNNAVQNFDILLEKLSKLFKENATTESKKLFLLMKAEKALISNKALSSCKAITTCKIYESSDILKTEENESPRLVIFLEHQRISGIYCCGQRSGIGCGQPNCCLMYSFSYRHVLCV
ncbi:uncharacterized protein LOC143901078 [Temnothorax americanus]|uniref:uncharacterized protein LOC143901078 n=1 Tax=Temnothorax americanus TaxID=1964332 RepID=UPI0040691EE9